MHATINIHEAKTQLSALVVCAEAGEEIVIAGANIPAVRLVPVEHKPAQRRLGEARGLVKIGPDFDALPEDLMEHFR